jgi:hypothetical protein
MEDSQEKHLYATKEEVLERVKTLAHGEEEITKAELDHLKTAFYFLLNQEREASMKAFLDGGGDASEYVVEQDPVEEEYKAEMALIKDKRQELFKQREEERQANLKRKQEIIERIKALTEAEDIHEAYKEVKSLQDEWHEIKSVPPENAAELWNSYKLCLEQFYDLLKLNFEAREYDFKKNLEAKTALCEAAEKLGNEEDVISAFHSLQELHNQFREIGPVAKELREEIWQRFKAASSIVNKRHAEHFDNIRKQEEENLEKKAELCDKVELINIEELKNSNDWEAKSKEIIDIQAEWKKIGFAPKSMNVKIFERFRAACDRFFSAKNEFFTQLKESFQENITKKEELVKAAQALQDSTDWKATADKMMELQKEWKTVGMVPRKIGDQLWNDFLAACNKFFEARNAATAGARSEQQENLQKKQEVVTKIKALAENDEECTQEAIKALQDEYAAIGHVPFKEKDKLYDAYREALDEAYGKMRKMRRNAARANHPSQGGGHPMSAQKRYNEKKEELATMENNLLFLTASSKKGNSLIDTMKQKIERLKEELEELRDEL